MYETNPYFYGTAAEKNLLLVYAFMQVPARSPSTTEILMITLVWRP